MSVWHAMQNLTDRWHHQQKYTDTQANDLDVFGRSTEERRQSNSITNKQDEQRDDSNDIGGWNIGNGKDGNRPDYHADEVNRAGFRSWDNFTIPN